MLRFLGILAAVLLSLSGQAQGVLSAEYFWDADPGQGNGTAMQAADAVVKQLKLWLLLDFHPLPRHFNMHVRGTQRRLGFSVVVNIEPSFDTVRAIQITAGESFWDNDPGAGNGTAFVAFGLETSTQLSSSWSMRR